MEPVAVVMEAEVMEAEDLERVAGMEAEGVTMVVVDSEEVGSAAVEMAEEMAASAQCAA